MATDILSRVNQSLADDIFLLTLSPRGTWLGSKPRTEYALVGAWLADLVRRGHIDIGQKVRVLDSTPTGEPDLDWVLGRLSGEPERGAYDLLMRLRDHPWRKAAERLRDKGIIREARERVFGLFPVTRYYVEDEAAQEEVNERFRRVVVDGSAPDPNSAALVKLLNAARMSTTLSESVFTSKNDTRAKWQMQRRMREIGEDDTWAGPTVAPAMGQIESALIQRSRPASGGP